MRTLVNVGRLHLVQPLIYLGMPWAITAFSLAVNLIIFAAVYNRISKPVNTALTSAAVAGRVPGDARQLQARWDSVIDARVVLRPSPWPPSASPSRRPELLGTDTFVIRDDLIQMHTFYAHAPSPAADDRS